MASLPSRQPQRRTSPPQPSTTNHGQAHERPSSSHAPSATSVDSQTLLLNDSSPPDTSSTAHDTQQQTKPTQSQESSGAAVDDEAKRCWICFSDETEDGPDASSWRTPCPCALTAHESCLLDWIADMEAPDASRSTSAPKEIRCPQCKSEITLSRPRNMFVEAVGAVEKSIGKLLWPGVLTGFSATLLIGAAHHGAHTIEMLFGHDDAAAILAPSPDVSYVEREIRRLIPNLAEPFFRGWRGLRVEVGLPIIPASLIASRTSMAEPILPILPILFFATHPESVESATAPHWPPSAALTLTILPYLRGIYDEYLERVWGEHERRWMKEIQPRLGHEEGQNGADGHQDDPERNDEDIVEVELGIEVPGFGGGGDDDGNNDEEEEDAAPPPQIRRRQRAPGLNEPPADAEHLNQGGAHPQQEEEALREMEARVDDLANQVQAVAAEQEEQHGNQDQGQQQNGNHQHQENNILISGTRVADTVLGALLFPSASAAMGEALRLLLPASWTVRALDRHGFVVRQQAPTGLLQTRWGRSILGGCLLVVLKDAIRIYCRWKMAQAFRQRRVLDWDKKRKTAKG